MKQALQKTLHSFRISVPIILGVLMLASLVNLVLSRYYSQIFTGNYLLDPLVGSIAGSVSVGIPVISYIIGGELLKSGVSLIAVVAFILSWATVGLVMMPLEMSFLGKKFAIYRNSINFVLSIIIAILTVITLKIFQW